MAQLTSLEDMVRALAGSIMEAQNMVEKAQIAHIASFFNEKHQPTMISLELPAHHSTADANGVYQYDLPLLSLVPHGSLVISEAEVELDVELGGFEETERSRVNQSMMSQTGQAAPAPKKASLMVNPATGGIAGKSGNAVHIKLKLASSEKSEGLARLLNDVVKVQGASSGA